MHNKLQVAIWTGWKCNADMTTLSCSLNKKCSHCKYQSINHSQPCGLNLTTAHCHVPDTLVSSGHPASTSCNGQATCCKSFARESFYLTHKPGFALSHSCCLLVKPCLLSFAAGRGTAVTMAFHAGLAHRPLLDVNVAARKQLLPVFIKAVAEHQSGVFNLEATTLLGSSILMSGNLGDERQAAFSLFPRNQLAPRTSFRDCRPHIHQAAGRLPEAFIP